MPPGRFSAVLVEEDSVSLDQITNPIDPQKSQDLKVAALRQLAKGDEPSLVALAKQLDKALCGMHTQVHCKDAGRIKEKANRPEILKSRPWHNVEHIRDALRFRTTLAFLPAVCDAFALFVDSGYGVVKIDLKKMLVPGLWGWRFAAFDMRMPGRLLVEYYVAIEEVMDVNDSVCHKLFEYWRNRSKDQCLREWREYQRDIEESSRVYQDAWDRSLKRLGINDADARSAWDRVRVEFGR